MLYKFKISSTVSFFCPLPAGVGKAKTFVAQFNSISQTVQHSPVKLLATHVRRQFHFLPGLQTRPWPALTPGRLLAKNRILVTWERGRQCHKNEGHRDFWCYRTSCHGMGAWKDEDRHIFRIIFCGISVWQLLQLLHNFVNLCKFFKNLMLQCNT